MNLANDPNYTSTTIMYQIVSKWYHPILTQLMSHSRFGKNIRELNSHGCYTNTLYPFYMGVFAQLNQFYFIWLLFSLYIFFLLLHFILSITFYYYMIAVQQTQRHTYLIVRLSEPTDWWIILCIFYFTFLFFTLFRSCLDYGNKKPLVTKLNSVHFLHILLPHR